jgi:hypothetical protein
MRDRVLLWMIAAAAVGVGLSFGACTQDDAFISFRYAEHLIAGEGLVFNPGEWVEGYTNLLWTLMMAAVMALGGEPVIGSTVLGLACLGGTVIATGRLGRVGGAAGIGLLVAPLLVASDAQLALESVEGLETALFALLVTLGTCDALGARRRGGALYFVLACLTRPEGVLLWGALQAGLLLRAWRSGEGMAQLRTSLRWSVPIVLCLVLLTAWRLYAYGDPLPNTFYAKTGGFAVPRGLAYVGAHVRSHPVLWGLALSGIWVSRRAPQTLPLVVMVGLYMAYVVVVGGDFKPTGRFIIPVLPMLAVLAQGAAAGLAERGRGGLGALVVLAAVLLFLSKERLDIATVHAQERHANLVARKLVGDWLATHTPPQAVIAIHSAGVIPFYAGRTTIDMWGLTDRTIARTEMAGMGAGMAGHEKTNPAYVFSRSPDLYLPEDKVFTLRAWEQSVEPGFPPDFARRYRPVSVPIEGRYLNMWVLRDGA